MRSYPFGLGTFLFGTMVALTATAQVRTPYTDRAAGFFDDREVREIRIYFDDPNWYNTLLLAHQTPADPYFPCRFRSGAIQIEKIGCRFKGNASAQRNGVKKPFKLDFNRYDDKATFLGLKKLNLNNFDLQPDFLREKLLLDIGVNHIAGMRGVYTRLYVNDAFHGLYLAVEQPDMTMMRSRWGAAEDGNLYEGEDRPGARVIPNLAWLGPDQSEYEGVYLLESNEEKNDYSNLIQFIDILNNTPSTELYSQLEPVADTENWMLGMAITNMVVNLDSYLGVGAEYLLYERTLDGKFIHVPWDHNESFGITGDGTPRLTAPAATDPFYLPGETSGSPGPDLGPAPNNARPLLEKMWAVEEYKRLYLRAMARVLRLDFQPQQIAARVNILASLIRSHVNEDPNKAYTSEQFEAALHNTVLGIPGINSFTIARYNFLRNYLSGQAQPVDVRINEVAITNDGSLWDEAGDADPWVEIHNAGPGPMSLGGFTLTDDPAAPRKWALPAVTLADGEHLLVWLDGETAEGAAHANFRMPAAGQKLYLFSSAVSSTTPIDAVTLDAVAAGQTQARVGLHGARWSATTAVTAKADNVIAAPPSAVISTGTGLLLVNELMASNSNVFQDPDEPGAYEDWFEVYNPGTVPVDMSGMYITDNPNNPTKWQVGAGVVIPAGGYLVFMADSEPEQGPRHANFALSADGESISIYASDGTTLIDTVTFGPQTANVSIGRVPGAIATWSALTVPTPGTANGPAR